MFVPAAAPCGRTHETAKKGVDKEGSMCYKMGMRLESWCDLRKKMSEMMKYGCGREKH